MQTALADDVHSFFPSISLVQKFQIKKNWTAWGKIPRPHEFIHWHPSFYLRVLVNSCHSVSTGSGLSHHDLLCHWLSKSRASTHKHTANVQAEVGTHANTTKLAVWSVYQMKSHLRHKQTLTQWFGITSPQLRSCLLATILCSGRQGE